MRIRHSLVLIVMVAVHGALAGGSEPPAVSGIYPHLAMFNSEGECGVGAIVPWAERLWVVTYAPHSPHGSSDKLYEITPDMRQIVRPESVGGTPANRMIHPESRQLFIGPYAIDERRTVRVIPPEKMSGRLTGIARHLQTPAEKIYYATMEEGFYEVDVKTLDVKELYRDGNSQSGDLGGTLLPGYHGKGCYLGQGRLVYANNGERGNAALANPATPSGCLAEWDGNEWRVVRRNQFTEVTGPGGLTGNSHPATDPMWSIGWDHRSLILMVLDGGRWHAYRLPKASHCYDGAHGWNTEWPRIRDIGESDLLMTMHGMFWRFPRTFRATSSAGIAPRSSYLKVIGDFCRWQDRLVFGCDDTARSEFLNKRNAKGNLAGPGQSQSNLWFVEPARLDQLGPPLGRGGVWLDEPVRAGEPSEPFLFAGFERRGVHIAADVPVTFSFEVDAHGTGEWTRLRDVAVEGATWVEFPPEQQAVWVRVRTDRDCGKATAYFQYADAFPAPAASPPITSRPTSRGLVRTCGDDRRTLGFATEAGYYELGADMKLRRVDDPAAAARLTQDAAIPADVLTVDAASIVYVDEARRCWRLPRGDIGTGRICREVCTERDLFQAGGTFYELPANNAGGFARIRPITTHGLPVHDYCSFRGLLVMSGVSGEGRHVVASDDGKATLWVGAVDDLWRFGKPCGSGGPWRETAIKADAPSDPYLMTGYDRKSVALTADRAARIRLEVDPAGAGSWHAWQTLDVAPGKTTVYRFPDAFNACWVRVVADADCTATAEFRYE